MPISFNKIENHNTHPEAVFFPNERVNVLTICAVEK
jgi:hypothetical protein